jgi:soluble lytic murein transglycosylase-like protein
VQQGKIKFSDREIPITGRLSLGRTPDNDVSFPDDANVSRNHAEIIQKSDGFYLRDLGSSNGTAVNGIPVSAETRLQNGDYIILGNSATLNFYLEGEAEPQLAAVQAGGQSGTIPAETDAGGNNKWMMIGAAGALGLALTIGAGALYLTRGSSCAATAKIIAPETGDTIIKPTEIELETENAGCVSKAVFLIDGVEFAKSDEPPFTVTLDPKDHPDLADGIDHALSVMLIDKNGEPVFQPAPVLLAFDTRQIRPPSNSQTASLSDANATNSGTTANKVSILEVQEMSKRLVGQFSGNFTYNLSNKQFLQEVQKRTADYAVEGYFEQASKYRDAINIAFVREQNLDAPLGFILAMSRSRFKPDKKDNLEGLYQMSNDFVTTNGYNGLCGNETLSDPKQNCAAKAAALYMKSIVFGVFDGDVIYAAAAFGKSPQEAGTWKATLPANRTDVWSAIKTPQEREQLVRFFAAGIVAENPQKFGLKRDRPLSELYRLAM